MQRWNKELKQYVRDGKGFDSLNVSFNPRAYRDETSMLVIKKKPPIREYNTVLMFESYSVEHTLTIYFDNETQHRGKTQLVFTNRESLVNAVIELTDIFLNMLKGGIITP